MQFVSDIKVVYGDEPSQAPSDRIREHNNLSDNINHGFTGRYVWLVPVPAPVGQLSVLVGFDIAIQQDPDTSLDNLAEGAGGDFRYLILDKSAMGSDKVIKEVALLRLGEEMTERAAEWDGNTPNINEGRGGSYLYLVWKTGPA